MRALLRFLIAPSTSTVLELGLLLLRVGIGISMVVHGAPKILQGNLESWRHLGLAMGNLGIHFWPVMWGFIAAITEFFGSMFFVLGLGTRIVSFFLAFMMFVAWFMHVSKGDPFRIYSHALELCIFFVSFMIIGGGKYSLDAFIVAKR
jgi:putative oxidoreductase